MIPACYVGNSFQEMRNDKFDKSRLLLYKKEYVEQVSMCTMRVHREVRVEVGDLSLTGLVPVTSP